MTFCASEPSCLSGSKDGKIKLWVLIKGEKIKTIVDDGPRFVEYAFNPDRTKALSRIHKKYKYWDLNDGKLIKTSDESSINTVCFSPSGKMALMGGSVCGHNYSGGYVSSWDLSAENKIQNKQV